MAQTSARDIKQTISLFGDDQVKRQLQSLGDAGEKALQQIEKASSNSSSALNAIGGNNSFARFAASIVPTNSALRDVAGNMERINGLGRELVGALGPGLVRDLGLAGLAAEMANIVRETARDVTALRNLSLTSGFSKEAIVGLKQAFQEANVDADHASFVLNKFAENTGEARAKALQFNSALQSGVTVLNGVRNAADAAAGAVGILRGKAAALPSLISGVSVLRGGVAPQAIDLQDPESRFRAVTGRGRASFPPTDKGQEEALQAFVEGLIRLNKVDASLANAIGTAEWGKRFKEIFPALEKAFSEGGFAKFKEEGITKGLVPSADDIASVERYNKAVNDLGDAWEASKRKVGLSLLPSITEAMPGWTHDIEEMSKSVETLTARIKNAIAEAKNFKIEDIGASIGNVLGKLFNPSPDTPTFGQEGVPAGAHADSLGLQQWINAQVEKARQGWGEWKQIASDSLQWLRDQIGGIDWSGMWSGFVSAGAAAASAIANSLNALWGVIKDIGSAIGTLFPGGSPGSSGFVDLASRPDFQIPDFSGALNFASGGLIRGPGGPLEDRVPIMASAGEFIVNAFATARHLPLLQAINGLDRPLIPRGPRFALGGLAIASAGFNQAPVHLHFEGRSFSLTGEPEVVGQLERHARRSKIMRTGAMPSWKS